MGDNLLQSTYYPEIKRNSTLKGLGTNTNSLFGGRIFGKDLSNVPEQQPEGYSFKLQPKTFLLPTAESKDFTLSKTKSKHIDGSMIGESSVSTKMSIESFKKDLESARRARTYDVLEGLEHYDLREVHNPQMVSVYAAEITSYLRSVEEKFSPKSGYMTRIQYDINEKMRAILIDWLVDVHSKFKLLPETLYLTTNLIDRYLEKVPVTRQKLQLVGVAAMLIACKYEEIYAPEVKDFVFVTDKAYTREEILEMEGSMLSVLEFNLTIPSSYRFCERFAFVGGVDEKTRFMAWYLIELALAEYKMLKHPASTLAAASIFLANKIFRRDAWNDDLIKVTKQTEASLRPCAKDLYFLLQNVEKSSLQAVKRKFSTPKFMEVSKIDLEQL